MIFPSKRQQSVGEPGKMGIDRSRAVKAISTSAEKDPDADEPELGFEPPRRSQNAGRLVNAAPPIPA